MNTAKLRDALDPETQSIESVVEMEVCAGGGASAAQILALYGRLGCVGSPCLLPPWSWGVWVRFGTPYADTQLAFEAGRIRGARSGNTLGRAREAGNSL